MRERERFQILVLEAISLVWRKTPTNGIIDIFELNLSNKLIEVLVMF